MDENISRRDFIMNAGATIVLAGLGTLALGATSYDEAEAAGLEKRLDSTAIAEAKAMFDKFVNNPKTVDSLNKINTTPSDETKWASLPKEVVDEYLKASPVLKDKCGVVGVKVGIQISKAGDAKLIMQLVTRDPSVYHQFSRPAKKR